MAHSKRTTKKDRPGRITVCLGEDLRARVEETSGDDKPSTWIRKLVARYFRGELREVGDERQAGAA